MRDIKGYEGKYAATSCGKIWSYKSKKFLKPRLDRYGYEQVNLCKDGKQKSFLVHRLIAEAYILNENNLPFVNHIDGNKEHNYINNLEWVTAAENNQHAVDTGLRTKGKKIKKVYDQLTGIVYANCTEAARAIGGTPQQVWNVCNKKKKSYKGRVFTYVD